MSAGSSWRTSSLTPSSPGRAQLPPGGGAAPLHWFVSVVFNLDRLKCYFHSIFIHPAVGKIHSCSKNTLKNMSREVALSTTCGLRDYLNLPGGEAGAADISD